MVVSQTRELAGGFDQGSGAGFAIADALSHAEVCTVLA
jgi:hypothetical protein